jgi:hypothetical protein
MDPLMIGMVKILMPFLLVLVPVSGAVTLLLGMRHLSLRSKELDIERETRLRVTDQQRQALEARLESVEANVGALVAALQRSLPLELDPAPRPGDRFGQPAAGQAAPAVRGPLPRELSSGPDAPLSDPAGSRTREPQR